MSLIDVSIPLVARLLLVFFPRMFFKVASLTSEEDITKKESRLRKIGCVLLAVAALYYVLTLTK